MNRLELPFPLNGWWCGDYQYVPSSSNNLYQSTVPFTIHFQVGRFGNFSGIVQDDPQLGAPDEGKVVGELKDYKITFIKKMPVYRVAYEGKLVALNWFVRERLQDELREQITHPDIFYEGFWQPSFSEFRGEWRISPEQIRLKSGRVLKSTGGTGTWRMAPCQNR